MDKKLIAVIAAAVLAGCTSGNSAIEPPTKSVANPLAGKLTFAVGTATYDLTAAGGGVVNGLNVVSAYRQANGFSAVLVDSPTITGPAGFAVPADPSGTTWAADQNTNHISATSQLVTPGAPSPATTFGQSGGVFAYGILPANSTNNASGGSNAGSNYAEPFYLDPSGNTAVPTTYLGGPPAYINTQDGTYTISGFGLGFNSFAGTTLAAGAYTLSLGVPTSPTTIGTVTATANLANTTPLGVYAAPVPTIDATGGASVTITVPAGVTETLVEFRNKPATSSTCFSAKYYTVVDHTPGPGTATVTLPNNVGKIVGGKQYPSFCTGDKVSVYAIGTDYRAYEASVGQNSGYASYDATGATGQTPNLFFPGGPQQADITVSQPGTATAP